MTAGSCSLQALSYHKLIIPRMNSSIHNHIQHVANLRQLILRLPKSYEIAILLLYLFASLYIFEIAID